jgi:hypothetical protein
MRRPIFTTALVAALAALALALAACGGDDDDEPTATTPTITAGATGATGAEGAPEGAAYDITSQEYLDAAIPDQAKAVEDYVADNPEECGDADPEPGGDFQVGVAIAAAQASPDTPLTDVISEECQEGS